MSEPKVISINRDFTHTPGGRYAKESEYSAEEFREKHLVPPLTKGERLIVDIDGTAGYGTSFLEEAFGGLARKFGSEFVEQHVEIKTDGREQYKAEIERFIRDAE